MPQRLEKLNRVVKAITNGKSNLFGGPRPKSSKASEEAKNDWKIVWMKVYDELRKETAKLRSENERVNVAELTNKLQQQQELTRELGKRLKMYTVAKVDAGTNTVTECIEEPSIARVDASTNTVEEPPIGDSSEVKAEAKAEGKTGAQIEAQTKRKNEAVVKGMPIHKCPDCDYTTSKKSALNDHRAEFCVTEPAKDMACQICGKTHTRRSLRVHLGGMIRSLRSGRSLRGDHAKYTLEQHQVFLDEIKAN